MALEVRDFDEAGHLLMTVSGSVDYQKGETIYSGLIEPIRRYAGSLFLLDVSDLQGRPDILQSIQTIDAIPADVLKKIRKLAVIDPVTSRHIFTVARSIMLTRGLETKWFRDRDAAIAWLRE
jgi:hypothetical protein